METLPATVTPRTVPRATYNVALIVEDMSIAALNVTSLAQRANLSKNTISRFLRGEHQTAKAAAAIARALGYKTARRYVRDARRAA